MRGIGAWGPARQGMRQDQQRDGSGLHLLLLGSNPTWARAVSAAAASLGADAVESAASAGEAITRLVRGDSRISHLLVQNGFADDRLDELLDLTTRNRDGRTALVMLGAGPVPARARVAARANRLSVRRALAAPAGHPGLMERLPVQELSDALASARLSTRYQPMVRIADGAAVGLEVLVRLDHPAHGTLGPDAFVPQMELAGLSRRLTEAVVVRAFRDHALHLAPLQLFMALNFPLDVLLAEEALAWLDARREEAGIDPGRIIIELTESRPVAGLGPVQRDALRRAILHLRGLGYGLAVDDVGPGMADHRALLALPFTAAKLDKELVRRAATDLEEAAFLEETVALARRAGLTVIAEGVEDAATWARMAALGVDLAQGFLVAKPLPAASLPLWLADWRRQAEAQTSR